MANSFSLSTTIFVVLFVTLSSFCYQSFACPSCPQPTPPPPPPSSSSTPCPPPPPPKHKPHTPPVPKVSPPPPPKHKPHTPPVPKVSPSPPPPPPPKVSPKPPPPPKVVPSPPKVSPSPPPPSPVVQPTPCPPPPSPPVSKPCPPPPSTPSTPTCPIDALKLDACVDLLGGLIHIGIGGGASETCCPVLKGLVDLDAAVCLCTTIRAKLLNINILLPLALQLLVDCGKHVPSGFQCPA